MWRPLISLAVSVAFTGHLAHSRAVPVAALSERAVEPRLQQLVGRWFVLSNTFGGRPDSTSPTLVVNPVALGRAVYSIWKQGSGIHAYEANALWAYDSTAEQVRVFEANSMGVVETHVGAFDETGALTLEVRHPASNKLVQRRVFAWSGDTLRMSAQFPSTGRTINHAVTLVRRR